MFRIQQLESKTLSWWNGERDNIDMNPVYQRRGRLWSQRDKAFLIDSILNQYDIPKIYIADFTFLNTQLNMSNKHYAIIDGKQRFESIFDFFDNRLALNQDFILIEDPALKLGGLIYKDLVNNFPKLAKRFENYNINVVHVITDEEGKINELFVRLNRSKPLTGAELRNAMAGPVPVLIREIAEHDFFKTRTSFSTSRGQDRNAAAKLLATEFVEGFVDTQKVILDRFVQIGVSAQSSYIDSAAQRIEKNLTTMTEIFMPRDELLSSQGHILLYYWLVRSYKSKYKAKIRPFLAEFNRWIRVNRRRAKAREEDLDQTLLHYDFLARSINSKDSLVQLYNTLVSYFAKFLGEEPST